VCLDFFEGSFPVFVRIEGETIRFSQMIAARRKWLAPCELAAFEDALIVELINNLKDDPLFMGAESRREQLFHAVRILHSTLRLTWTMTFSTLGSEIH
jgi:hypothetical protein